MADETTTETVDETKDETKPETQETTPESKDEAKPEDKETDAAGDGDDEDGELPEWARKKLSKANGEAANYRTQLRDLQAKLEGAKTPEEVAQVTKELSDKNTELAHEVAVQKALRTHELEDDDAIFFEGKTPEQIEVIAKKLAAKNGAGSTTRKLKGGLDPHEGDPTPDNPRELARMTRR